MHAFSSFLISSQVAEADVDVAVLRRIKTRLVESRLSPLSARAGVVQNLFPIEENADCVNFWHDMHGLSNFEVACCLLVVIIYLFEHHTAYKTNNDNFHQYNFKCWHQKGNPKGSKIPLPLVRDFSPF